LYLTWSIQDNHIGNDEKHANDAQAFTEIQTKQNVSVPAPVQKCLHSTTTTLTVR
jgi:hypothetical protein